MVFDCGFCGFRQTQGTDECSIGTGIGDGNLVYAFSYIQEFHILLFGTVFPTGSLPAGGIFGNFCIEAGIGGDFKGMLKVILNIQVRINNPCTGSAYSCIYSNRCAGFQRHQAVNSLRMVCSVAYRGSRNLINICQAVIFQVGKGYVCIFVSGFNFVYTCN